MKTAVFRASSVALPLLSRLPTHPQGLGVIMAHGVYDRIAPGEVRPPRSSVSLEMFERNILSLRGSFNFISLDDAVAMLEGAVPWRKRCLVITFDDSLKTHVEVIAPKLVEWGLPATFYLSTATIDDQTPYWWLRLEYAMAKANGRAIKLELPNQSPVTVDTTSPQKARQELAAKLRGASRPQEIVSAISSIESQLGFTAADVARDYPSAQPLTWDDVAKLCKMGMTIGGHTVNHPNLTLLDGSALEHEFTACRAAIEKHAGAPCRHFCYPHGFHSAKVRSVAEKLGFASGVTVDSGLVSRGDSPCAMKRFGLSMRENELAWQLSGLPTVLDRVRRRNLHPNLEAMNA